MHIAQRQGDKVLMSTETSCHFVHLLQVSDFIQFFFMKIHVYNPAAGADSPRDHNFDVKRKALSLYPFVASVIKISL